MKPAKPKPIRVRAIFLPPVDIEVVGYRDPEAKPFISVSLSDGATGYIEDRDIKRLKAWCEDCLRRRK